MAGDVLKGAAEIAEYLGVDVEAVYRLVRSGGPLPYYRVGRTILSRKSTMNAWVEGQMSANASATDSPRRPPGGTGKIATKQ